MEQEKVALIINSASYDRVSYALSIANVSAAHLKDVYVLFTYGGILRLLENKADVVGEETTAWMQENIKKGLKKGTIPKISDMLSFSRGFGVKIFACSGAMAFHNITKEELAMVDDVMGISQFLEKVQGASTVLYI